jgi:hypothetical protein
MTPQYRNAHPVGDRRLGLVLNGLETRDRVLTTDKTRKARGVCYLAIFYQDHN